MSAFGTKRTSNYSPSMCAFGGKADIGLTLGNAAFDPKQTLVAQDGSCEIWYSNPVPRVVNPCCNRTANCPRAFGKATRRAPGGSVLVPFDNENDPRVPGPLAGIQATTRGTCHLGRGPECPRFQKWIRTENVANHAQFPESKPSF